MNKINELLKELDDKIPKQEILNEKISKSNVGWHIEHTLLTINLIINELKKSNSNDYKWSFKLSRIIVFLTNKIPRGKGKSPRAVVPKAYDQNSLIKHLHLTYLNVESLNSISADKYFNHPYFGNLNLGKTIKFLEIHTKHHLEIINDIVNNKA